MFFYFLVLKVIEEISNEGTQEEVTGNIYDNYLFYKLMKNVMK